jgi:formylglycine-generating enzyme required for sulfatase activity
MLLSSAAEAARKQGPPVARPGNERQDDKVVHPRRDRLAQPTDTTGNQKSADLPGQRNSIEGAYKLGLESYKKAQYEDAIRYFKQVVNLNPKATTLAAAQFYLGDSYSELGRPTEAVVAYQEALRLNPRDDVALNNLGVAYNELGKYNEALEDYKQALSVKADIAVAHYNVGVAYYNLKQYREAAEAYQRALHLQPDFAELAYNNLGLTYQNMERYEDAIESYRQAIRLKPDFAEVYFNLGRAYNKMGNNDAALKQYDILKTLNPDEAEQLSRIVNPPKPSLPEREKTVAFKVEMAAIPGGTFLMGRSDVSAQNPMDTNQFPAHPVTVAPFHMDKTEVTNAEYALFVRATGYAAPPHWANNQPPAGQEQWPVTNVSLADAQAFAAWRSKRDSVVYRLPTEEEWEFAARDGANAYLYPWGDVWRDGWANVEAEGPQPVGSYAQGASAWGVVDLIGNAWEWTASKNSIYPGNKSAQLEDKERDSIITRGGAYSSKATGAEAITATRRIVTPASTKHPALGFRLVRPGS